MIVGIGVDICQVDRLAAALKRQPGLAEKLFTETERFSLDGKARKVESLAARFAAKEALAKALGAPSGLAWLDAEVISQPSGQPVLSVKGTVEKRTTELGVGKIHLTLTHDGGFAVAFVVCEA